MRYRIDYANYAIEIMWAQSYSTIEQGLSDVISKFSFQLTQDTLWIICPECYNDFDPNVHIKSDEGEILSFPKKFLIPVPR